VAENEGPQKELSSSPEEGWGEGLKLEGRQALFAEIEALRSGRNLVCFLNFDRAAVPAIPGLTTQFDSSGKEALFRVLKETSKPGKGVDLLLYTRGGDVNAVWALASILREFDDDFEVLVPFRCHSAGTLLVC
jgi:hypothetical protein